MRLLTDFAYLGAAAVTSPIWIARMAARGKLRTDWRARLGYVADSPAARAPDEARRRLLIHAVSVGEVNAIRALVDRLAAGPDPLDVVIATTTDTGTARARELFGGRYRLVRYPFDFSAAVDRLLDAVRPDAVALVELEVWPNFVASCDRRGIPVAVINGRLSARSFRRYRLARPFLSPTFARLAAVAAQDEAYAVRFRAMGVPAERVAVCGTMKWDTAQVVDDEGDASAKLAIDLGIDRSRPLVVAGSTAPGEHELLVAAVPPGIQLLCAPRKPEWFDDAARVLDGCVRRSRAGAVQRTPAGRTEVRPAKPAGRGR
ncbi:MAG: glycosyltransferase N-terminal domain-containing protein, partial [Phycisphaerales bacterium]